VLVVSSQSSNYRYGEENAYNGRCVQTLSLQLNIAYARDTFLAASAASQTQCLTIDMPLDAVWEAYQKSLAITVHTDHVQRPCERSNCGAEGIG
jgi:hypothetical protein